MKKIKQYLFPTMIALSALSVSASAAFYSITGLSKLFVGASFAVIIMAASLEVAKLVIASYLYQYWDKTRMLLKVYLTLAVFILILITSAGIYGFLSSAYEQTASKNIVVEKQIAALENKKARYLDTRDSYSKEKAEISKSTSELRQALSTGTMTQYKDRETGQIINVANTGNRKAFEKQLEKTLKKDSILDSKIGVLNDSIFSLESQVLDSQSKAETSGELGPLKYISKLLNIPMDKIINWFILVIIFVFDPLAISLVIAANNAFNKARHPEQLTIYNEKKPAEPVVKEFTHLDPNTPPPVAPPTPPPPMNNSWVPPIFKRKKDDDIKTY
jgi:hypothetical protein